MKYLDDTFVTPVFNGSASLRSAAGQLIENVCKSARRKEEMSDDYIENLYHEVSSLYRLDQIKAEQNAADKIQMADEEEKNRKTGWNELPRASRALLIILPGTWLLITGFSLYRAKKTKRKN